MEGSASQDFVLVISFHLTKCRSIHLKKKANIFPIVTLKMPDMTSHNHTGGANW